MPCQLIFPDDTMAIGSPALPRQNLFPADRRGVLRVRRAENAWVVQGSPRRTVGPRAAEEERNMPSEVDSSRPTLRR